MPMLFDVNVMGLSRIGGVQREKLAFYQLNYSRSPGTFKYRKLKGLLASLD